MIAGNMMNITYDFTLFQNNFANTVAVKCTRILRLCHYHNFPGDSALRLISHYLTVKRHNGELSVVWHDLG